jgi:hypothetical protein
MSNPSFSTRNKVRGAELAGPTSTRLMPSFGRRKWDQQWDRGPECAPNPS